MPHLKVKFSLFTLDINNDIRFGFYMHELGVNLDGEIVRSESENSGTTSTK